MKLLHQFPTRIVTLALGLMILSAPAAAALALPQSRAKAAPAPASPALGSDETKSPPATPPGKGKPGEAPAPTGGTPFETPASGDGALGSATISVADDLDLVTASLFSGGIKVFDFAPNVLISSTLPAAKPEVGTSTKYQDAQLLTAHGGVLNLVLSWGSVNVDTAPDLAKIMDGHVSPIGRQALADRRYLGPIEKILTDDAAQAYFLNGIGVSMLNRNADSTTGPKVSTYGIGGLVYLGFGFDGAFIPIQGSNDAGGQYRFEVFGLGSWTDPTTTKALYPTAAAKDFNTGVGTNLQIVITKKLGLNVQASWPVGRSRDYMGKILLVGITISR